MTSERGKRATRFRVDAKRPDKATTLVAVAVLLAAFLFAIGHSSQVTDRLAQLRNRAESGDSIAQTKLGHAYAEGRGVEKDLGIAKEWYERAVVQSNPEAQFGLAAILLLEDQNSDNYERAIGLLRSSAESGYVEAKVGLGYAYMNGSGVRQDSVLAAKWVSEAAKDGNSTAQLLLARMFFGGSGLKRSYHDAYKWAFIASETGNGAATKELKVLATALSEVEVADATTAAERCLKTGLDTC